MSRTLRIFIVLVLLLQPVIWVEQPGQTPAFAQEEFTVQLDSGMPGFPLPAQPVPHHDPGHLSKAMSYSTQVERLNDQGAAESIQLNGLDALLTTGAMEDPLQGNYTLVELDKLLISAYNAPNSTIQNVELITPNLSVIAGSAYSLGGAVVVVSTAADLNGDTQDEQIAAWIGASNHIFLAAGEMNGSMGRISSSPTALARGSTTIDVLARGYDETLWYCQYNTLSPGCIWQSGGGLLLSAPAAVSRSSDKFDVFTIGSDNLTYQRHWTDPAWAGGWTLLDSASDWPALAYVAPTPELAAPAAISRDAAGIDLFRLGSDNTLRWRHTDDGSAWGAWENLGGALASGPAALAVNASQMVVFALGVDGALWYRTYSGSTWGAWLQTSPPAGVELDSAPAALSPSLGVYTVYFRSTDGALRQATLDGGTWTWGTWGGTLFSNPGAAAVGGVPYVFAMAPGGSLQSGHSGGGWTNRGGLPVSPHAMVDTGALANPTVSADYDNATLDLAAGYFSGDGRQQVVMAHTPVTNTNKIRIGVYDNQNGFSLSQRRAVVELDGWFPRIAAGDADGDGVDEIAVAYLKSGDIYRYQVRIYKVEKDVSGSWTGALTLLEETPTIQSYWDADPSGDDWFWFAHSMRIAAGDLVIDSDGRARDEFVVVSDWGDSRVYEDFALWVQMYFVDYGNIPRPGGAFCNADTAACHVYALYKGESDDDKFIDRGDATGVALATGDVNGDGYDEVVVTQPVGFDDSDWPDLVRYISVFNAKALNTTWPIPLLSSVRIPGYNRYSPMDTLAVGDMDLDLRDEIVFYEWAALAFYDLNTTNNTLVRKSAIAMSLLRIPSLTMGDFTRQSLRVGKPTMRIQNRVDTLVALMNMPPKHRDLVVDNSGTLQRVEVLMEPCRPMVDPWCTHAKHATKTADVSTTKSTSVRDWGLSQGFENEFSILGAKIKTSVNYSYGNHFEKTTTEISSTTISESATAATHDIIVYYGVPYKIWEYPVLDPDTGQVLDYMTVAFPMTTSTPNAGTQIGDLCEKDWYSPGHQIYNMWSYNPAGIVFFPDYDPTREIYRPSSGMSGGTWFEVTKSHFTGSLESSKISHSVDASAEVSGKIPLIGQMKSTTKGHYGSEEIQSDEVSTTDETAISVWIGPQETKDAVTVFPILYWAKTGYLALDYQLNFSSGSTWDLYSRPDPAFILPWYGYPDIDPVKRVAPPCGSDDQYYSPDLVISPATAKLGQTVTISATVHSFSDEDAANVLVRFYLDEPASNVLLGERTIDHLRRSEGGATVAITTTAALVGKHKVYAVLDPLDDIDETHDSGDVIDNNVAYGDLQIGDVAYFDSGPQDEDPYLGQTYTQTNSLQGQPLTGLEGSASTLAGLQVSFYVPPGNLSKVTRFELQDRGVFVFGGVGNSFKLAAFQGTGAQAWVEVPDLVLNPAAGQPAGVLVLDYSSLPMTGIVEADLRLYRKTVTGWEDAGLSCTGIPALLRFEDEGRIVVPICRSGTYSLAVWNPGEGLLLPAVMRK